MSKKSARDTRSVVYFEIGSGSVAAACGVVTQGILTLHWSKRIYRPLDDSINYDEFKKVTLSTLMDLAMTLTTESVPAAQRDLGFDPKHAECFVFLGAPWYVATTRTATKEQEVPFRITEDMVHEYVERDLQSVLQAVKTANRNPLRETPVPLETLTLAARLNGYPVRHYVGKECASFTLTTYYSMIAETIQDNIDQVLSRVLPHYARTSRSTTLAHYQTMQSAAPFARNTAFVEVGAEITNVCSVRDGILVQCITYATGTNHFLRQVAHKNAKRDEAVSKATQLIAATPETTAGSPLESAVNSWRSELVQAIDTLEQGEPWPHTVALVVNDPWSTPLKRALEGYWEHETYGSVEPIRVVPLTEILRKNVVQGAKGHKDARLALLGQSLAHRSHVYPAQTL